MATSGAKIMTAAESPAIVSPYLCLRARAKLANNNKFVVVNTTRILGRLAARHRP